MREIVFDTETTGFSFADGDRMVEIGRVELVNKVETGRTYHAYFHPERAMPAEAQRVHGLSDVFLSDKKLFREHALELIEFIGDCPLVAHNAGFDFSFLNGELARCGRPHCGPDRMIDTLTIARSRHPGAKHSLDALCSRYGIDLSQRQLHGALLDAQLLAQVYVELTGGRQITLGLAVDAPVMRETPAEAPTRLHVRPARHFAASPAELARHATFLSGMEEPLWGSAASG